VLTVTLTALTAGVAVQTAGPSLAAVGTEPGNLVLSPATGPLTTQATWSTTDACPAGFQGSAEISEYTISGTFVSLISDIAESPGASPITGGILQGTVGALLATQGSGLSATNPGTDEWVVDCYSALAGTGNVASVQDLWVTATASGTYTTSANAPTATVTTLTASPSPAPSGGTETLTASVTAADGTSPAGTVQFASGSTNIGAPVPVNTSGVATPATTTFTAPTTTVSATTVALSAVFTPSDITATVAPSTGTFSLTVQSSGALLAGNIPVDVSVPVTGSLTVTVSTEPVSLTVQSASSVPNFVGTQPGDLQLNPATGSLTATPTWSTTTPCPAGFQSVAELVEAAESSFNTTSVVANISPAVASITSPFSGTLDFPIGTLLSNAGIDASNPGTAEFLVGCWTGPGGAGNVEYVQSILVSVAAGATTYTTSTPPSLTAPLTATGGIDAASITITDTRNTAPGWSVSGQDTAFTGSGSATGSAIPGDNLGWTPQGLATGGATLGPPLAPGASPGLADAAQVLESAPSGSGVGTNQVGAALTLDIPAAAPPGDYTSTLTITYLLTGP